MKKLTYFCNLEPYFGAIGLARNQRGSKIWQVTQAVPFLNYSHALKEARWLCACPFIKAVRLNHL